MGLLALGTPLDWPETKPLAEHIRDHGITQFLHTWDRWKDAKGKGLLWGDEIEYMVVSFDDAHRAALLSLRQSEILQKLQTVVLDPGLERYKPKSCAQIPTFHPEYGRFMLESTPGCPFTGSVKDLIAVEADMQFRRKIIRSYLLPHELPITLTSWPRLGVTDGKVFTDPPTKVESDKSASRSHYVGQLLTNPHARFPTLTANIRQRRGSLVDIRVPLYLDTHTDPHAAEGWSADLPHPNIHLASAAGPSTPRIVTNGDSQHDGPTPGPAKPRPGTPYIHMDAMAFGMGCCCLQITFQAWNVDEARRVYDALVPVAPIMLALTAGSPAFRGYLADVDARWNVIAASVDDRTEEERGLKPLKNDKYRIPKSRYDSVDMYISNDERNKPQYQDTDVPINEAVRQRLLDNGLDNHLASHIAHLFIRDPLVQFSETIDQDDEASMDHFENIQSTNWQTIRFKPPPVNSPIGWRVEFRSMEVQMTDYENAAFSIFIVLLTRAIISFDLNFYMPISQVDDNMQRSQERDAARQQRFHFRKNIFPLDRPLKLYNLASRPVTPPEHANGTHTPSGRRLSDGSRARPISFGPPSGSSTPSRRYRDPHHLDGLLGGLLGPHAGANGRSEAGSSAATSPVDDDDEPDDDWDETEAMTMDEVINGKGDFPGLLGVVNAYLNSINVDFAAKCELRQYLDLIKFRAKGKLVTPAHWIRNFITSHPKYGHDSVVTEEINYDLAKAVDEVYVFSPSPNVPNAVEEWKQQLILSERGVRKAPELLGENYVGSGPTGCL